MCFPFSRPCACGWFKPLVDDNIADAERTKYFLDQAEKQLKVAKMLDEDCVVVDKRRGATDLSCKFEVVSSRASLSTADAKAAMTRLKEHAWRSKRHLPSVHT